MREGEGERTRATARARKSTAIFLACGGKLRVDRRESPNVALARKAGPPSVGPPCRASFVGCPRGERRQERASAEALA